MTVPSSLGRLVMPGKRARRATVLVSLLATLGPIATGCGDDDGADDAEELGREVDESLEEGGVRVAAETVRVSLSARELGEDEHLRDVSIIEDVTEDVPGDPEVVGLQDGDGDGRDDDGRVELRVGDESACLSVSRDGEDVDVEGGGCS